MKIGLASISLFPLPLKAVLRRARQAGFDFVEICLGKWDKEKVDYFQSCAEELRLTLHFHLPWTTNSSQEEMKRVNHALTLLGLLPREGYQLDDWFSSNARPLVAYAERINELAGQEGVWFQSVACQRSLTDRSPRLSCVDFLRIAREKNLPIVFDTMHFIEYVRGESGIEHSHFPTHDVLDEWERFWSIFGSQIKEIHFNDFSKRRNLWPDTGTAPLKEFAALVKQSGWDGCIVSEVQPKFPFPYGAKKLLSLRKAVENYFA